MNCAHIDWPDDQAYFTDFFKRAKVARVPLSGSLELTRRCNLRCIQCYLGPQERVRDDLYREMTTSQVLAIIDQVIEAGCMHLLITGGDPLLRLDFPDVYRRAKLGGIDVTVFTNGTPVTERIVDLFRDLPPRIVEITLYGATAETYERITGVSGSYRRCLAGVERLHAAGLPLGLKTVLMTANLHELDAIEALAASFGAKFRFDALLNACLDGTRGPLTLRVPAGDAVRLEFTRDLPRQAWLDLRARYPVIEDGDRLVQCGAGQTGFHVDAYGNLQSCLMLPQWSCSLLTGTFAEGWTGLAAVRQVPAAAGKSCAACQHRQYCGYCPGMLALESGDPNLPSPYLCALGAERLRAIAAYSTGETNNDIHAT